MEFFETVMGKRFYTATIPSIASSLEKIVQKMEEQEKSPAANVIPQYVFVKTNNFDETRECTGFATLEEAQAYLHWYWEDYVNDEYANGSELAHGDTYHENNYAKVTWTDGCVTEFRVIQMTKKREEFAELKEWGKYIP